MLKAECRGESADLAAITRGSIPDNLDLPVVLVIANRQVAIARDLLIGLGDRGGDLVRVEVAAGLRVDETDRGSVGDEAWLLFGDVLWVVTVRVEEPIVVGILVVVAGDLLLSRPFGVSLDV